MPMTETVRRLTDRTHGRWPLVAAAAAIPATGALVTRREKLAREDGAVGWLLWAALPAFFWHQTEEWVWPGGFLPWFNREVAGGGEDEFPITRAGGFAINVGFGWGLAVASGALGMRAPTLGATVFASDLANAAMHLGLAARRRRRNPGTVTSALVFVPLGVAGLRAIARHPRGGRRPVAVGLALGALSGAGTFAVMRRRVAGRRAGARAGSA
jgi:uncharacterized protein with HXXEE motif